MNEPPNEPADPTAPNPNDPAPPASPDKAYEGADPERPATATPTEPELEREVPGGRLVRHDPYAALRYWDYCLFSAGWMTAVIGSLILTAALSWQVYDLTGEKYALGWVGGIQAIPLILLALPGGHIADIFDRRRIVTLTASCVGCITLIMAMLPYERSSIPWLYLLLFFNSCVVTLGRPARSALVPQIVPPEVFSNAVTWNASFFQVASMIGPTIGGFAIAHSARLAYCLSAATSFFFALVLLIMPKPRFAEQHQTQAGESLWSQLLAGIRFVWNTRIILATITLDLFAVLLGGAVYLLPVFAKDILQVGPVGYGWLRAAEAIGAFCMAMLLAHLPPMKRAGRNLIIAVIGFGLVTIIFGISKWFWLSFLMLVLLGACDNISVVVRHTLVQVLTPDRMRGRVSSVNNIFIVASNELGGLESGVTAAWWGPVASVVVGGVGSIVTVILIALKWPEIARFGSLQDARPIREGEDPTAPAQGATNSAG